MKKRVLLIVIAFAMAVMPVFAREGFSDISGHWAETVINKWSARGIIKGYDGMFNPDESIKRGDMAVILGRLMGYTEKSENVFSDLPAEAYYTDSVLALNHAGIMLGNDGKVRPEEKITREEAMVMFSRVFAFEKQGTAPEFEDKADISSWALESVELLCGVGVVKGSNGKILPKNNITRAEILQLIENAMVVTAYIENTQQPDNAPGNIEEDKNPETGEEDKAPVTNNDSEAPGKNEEDKSNTEKSPFDSNKVIGAGDLEVGGIW